MSMVMEGTRVPGPVGPALMMELADEGVRAIDADRAGREAAQLLRLNAARVWAEALMAGMDPALPALLVGTRPVLSVERSRSRAGREDSVAVWSLAWGVTVVARLQLDSTTGGSGPPGPGHLTMYGPELAPELPMCMDLLRRGREPVTRGELAEFFARARDAS